MDGTKLEQMHTHICACTHSCTHTVLNAHLWLTCRHWTNYVKSEIIAANSTLTMQNLMFFQQMRALFLSLYVAIKHFLFASQLN